MSEQFYDKHIFGCINQKDPGKKCCAAEGSDNLLKYMKDKCKDSGVEKVRVTKSQCLGRCSLGPVMVVYPEGIWYQYKTENDIDQIINRHLLNGQIVDKLKLSTDR